MVVASVAAPMVHTAAVRMPAMMCGADKGASTSLNFCHPVMPMPSAASITPGSRLACAVTAFLRMGSRAYRVSAISAGRKPSVGRLSPKTPRSERRIGKNSASSASAGMV